MMSGTDCVNAVWTPPIDDRGVRTARHKEKEDGQGREDGDGDGDGRFMGAKPEEGGSPHTAQADG